MFVLNRCDSVVLILAAGRSERFRVAGGHGNKLEALLTNAGGTRSVLDHVIAAAHGSGLPWHVILPSQTIHHVEQGIGTSISTGVAATSNASGWLILPGDLPLITSKTIRLVADALRPNSLVVPFFQQMQGHPVGFGREFRNDLLELRGDSGARAILAKNQIHRLDVDDQGCVFDVDTPDLLKQAQARFNVAS
ncbi:MAG: hypothetical protein RJB15_158 [Pseudomonadota bacterium]|jgi:molybdenum cofactor cytidylyltransferase